MPLFPATQPYGFRLPASAFPSNPSVGDLFYETDTEILWVWKGSAWSELSGPRYEASMFRATSYNHAVGWNKVPLDTTRYDPRTVLNLANSRYVCPVAGLYEVEALCEIQLNNNPQRWVPAVRRNAVEDIHVVWGPGPMIRGGAGGDVFSLSANGTIRCSAADYLEFWVYNSGGNVTVINGNTGANFAAHLTVRRVGPVP